MHKTLFLSIDLTLRYDHYVNTHALQTKVREEVGIIRSKTGAQGCATFLPKHLYTNRMSNLILFDIKIKFDVRQKLNTVRLLESRDGPLWITNEISSFVHNNLDLKTT